MALRKRAVSDNAPGELFVDDSCIDCDTCRNLAPGLFGYSAAGTSRVVRQPAEDEWPAALRAVVSCPTASIGAGRSARGARLPTPLDGPVSLCGYASEASYGATSYFVRRQDGNVLVDSPRAVAPLLRALREQGGVARMFLTHRDDVADHAKLRAAFGCERILHAADAFFPVERRLEGDAPVALAPGMVAIPVPGHTRGSCALLVDDTYLFTGDHLWADEHGRLEMGRNVCWYSWPEQQRSLRKLLDFRFEWVLPGHGRWVHLPPAQMRAELERLARG